ncbi:hypothetical protein HN51_023672, partial [Arachis hypogaea]
LLHVADHPSEVPSVHLVSAEATRHQQPLPIIPLVTLPVNYCEKLDAGLSLSMIVFLRSPRS